MNAGRPIRLRVWIGMLLAVLTLNAGALLGSERMATFGDNAYTMYPLRVEVARQWLEGHLPLWNPYQRAGTPLLADAFSGALYPGNLLFLLQPGDPRYRALELVAVVHFVLGASFLYFFLLDVGLLPLAAAFGALVYAGNGSLLWLTSLYIEAQNAAVWLPLILLAIHRIARGRSFWGWSLTGAVAVAVQVFAGQPEYSFYGALIAGAYAVLLVTGPDRRWCPIGAFGVIFALGAALAAVQLLPTFELAALSRRGLRVPLAEFLSHAVSPRALVGWAIPGVAVPLPDPWPSIGTAYLGMLGVPFIIEGLRGIDRRRLFFGAILVGGFLLAIGPATPLGAFLWELPVVNAFRYPYKHLFEITFAASVLAGMGADGVLRGRPRSAPTVAVAATAVLVASLWFLLGRAAGLAPGGDAHVDLAWLSDPLDPRRRTAVAALGIVVVLPFLVVARARTAVALAFVATLISFAGNRADVLHHARWDEIIAPPPASLVERLRGSPDALPWRYVLLLGGKSAFDDYRQEYLTANYPSEFRVPAVHGCCPFLWAPLARALGMSDDGLFTAPRQVASFDNRALDVLSCRNVGAVQKVLWENASFAVTERARALPIVRFVDGVRCGSQEEIDRMLRGRGDDPARVALVDCDARPALPDAIATAPAVRLVEIRERGPSWWRFATRIEGSRPGFLVLSQSDVPGWRASIGGVPSPLYRAYGLVQGVVVPPGERSILVEYMPMSVVRGAAVSLCALAVAGVLGWRAFRRRKGRSADA